MAFYSFARRSFSIVLIVFALLVVEVLFSPIRAVKQTRLFSNVVSAPSLRSLIDFEEAKYRRALLDREDLVRKWGPTVNDVQS